MDLWRDVPTSLSLLSPGFMFCLSAFVRLSLFSLSPFARLSVFSPCFRQLSVLCLPFAQLSLLSLSSQSAVDHYATFNKGSKTKRLSDGVHRVLVRSFLSTFVFLPPMPEQGERAAEKESEGQEPQAREGKRTSRERMQQRP